MAVKYTYLGIAHPYIYGQVLCLSPTEVLSFIILGQVTKVVLVGLLGWLPCVAAAEC